MGVLVEHGHDRSGTTANRPVNAEIGQEYFDTTLGQDLTWNGTEWQAAGIESSAAGEAAGTGVSASESSQAIHKTVITLEDLVIATADADTAGAHGSQKIYDFPEGHILIHGAHFDLDVESTGASDGIADTATYEIGIGSAAVATDNAALTTTEDNIVNGATGDLAGGAASISNVNGSGLALDGSATAADAILNVAIAADDHGANAGELTINGTVTILWSKLGDD